MPADLIAIKTNNEDGHLYIRTDQLDGETDWKLRKIPAVIQKTKEEDLLKLNGFLKVDLPNANIYDFNGVLNIITNETDSINSNDSSISIQDNEIIEYVKDPLSLENTLWANSVLASDYCIGLVIYTGKETRAEMNSSKPKAKFGIVDLEVNLYTKILFVLMFILAGVILALRGFDSTVGLNSIAFIRFLVLINTVLPISLRVNLDIAKTVNSVIINKNEYSPTIVRNSNIPEELGRIGIILSDKTGTLTRNTMAFKQMSLETQNIMIDNENDFNSGQIERAKYTIKVECRKSNAAAMDLITFSNPTSVNPSPRENVLSESEPNEIVLINSLEKKMNLTFSNDRRNSIKKKKRSPEALLRDSITALALCNSVVPIKSTTFINNPNQIEIEYEASSPDELSLVQFAKELNMTLSYRDDKTIRMINSANEIEEYKILSHFPFNSETKRMGIILRSVAHNHIIFYLKGSENVMCELVCNQYKQIIREKADELASKGLRTLVIAQKVVHEEVFQSWYKAYSDAQLSFDNRKEKLVLILSTLEKDMDFLCVTGVEDTLQEEVVESIEAFKNAGINVWMLTGDKVETATCVAISAGLLNKEQSKKKFYIKDNADYIYVENALKEFEELVGYNYSLIIDGICLDIAIEKNKEKFFKTLLKAPAVIICRCSPTQKAKIAKNLPYYTKKRILAIGDGGNDVAMIQEANCGIGIVGKEGKQASLAADFSINEFKDLKLLLLWFGRQSYINTAKVCHFVIQRGLILAFMQYIFCIMFYYFPLSLYGGFLIMGYTSIYTNFPVFTILLDRDTKIKNVIKFPTLYLQLQKGRYLNIKMFLFWFLVSLFQAAIIMLGSVYFFPDQYFFRIVTITFTGLFFAELFNIYSQISYFHHLMILSLLATIFMYMLSLIFLHTILDVYYVMNWLVLLKILIIVIINWLPVFLYFKLKNKVFPEHHHKLNKMNDSSGISLL